MTVFKVGVTKLAEFSNSHYLEIGCRYQHINPAGTWIETYYLVRPYKRTAWIWFWCSRTISCEIRTAVNMLIMDNWYTRQLYGGVSNKHDSKVEGSIGEWASVGYFSVVGIHFAGYDCWADTPDTDPVVLQCNTAALR